MVQLFSSILASGPRKFAAFLAGFLAWTSPTLAAQAESPFERAHYKLALSLATKFFYAQYSGKLPSDFPISWRGDSGLTDGADQGLDLTGGWYDAGDHMKFGLPMAFSATSLAWAAIEFPNSFAATESDRHLKAHLRWVNDYFLRCYQRPDPQDLSQDLFYAQIGVPELDHAYWGPAEDMAMARPSFAVSAQAPGSEVTAETAAALAAASIIFTNSGDTGYGEDLLRAARRLFEFSETYQGRYSDAIPEAAGAYKSYSGYQDELGWAAAWLFRATNEITYLSKAQNYYSPPHTDGAFSWDYKDPGTAALLAQLTGDPQYWKDLDAYLAFWRGGMIRTPGTHSNHGLAWFSDWGPNRYALSSAYLANLRAEAASFEGHFAYSEDLTQFATDQLDYILGDNPLSQSYVTGFGPKYPRFPHHRGASGAKTVTDAKENRHSLPGALVGGPHKDGSYSDNRENYRQNEVATDYNAALVAALAARLGR